MNINKMRNFSIIAHIDHGKSTLADRILEITNTVNSRDIKAQMLDNMEIERERGITIKLNAVQIQYRYHNEDYLMHLIDTPGHVDFSYEVSRSLAACEGAVLVVDAAQGIQAQTLANVLLALENNLTIIPVINKIDLPNADVQKVTSELVETLGFDKEDIICVSGKTGVGVDTLLDAIVERIPAPQGDINKPAKALIFDSIYDAYRGGLVSIRMIDGVLKVRDEIKMIATGGIYEVTEIGISNPEQVKKTELTAGEVGYLGASIKSVSDIQVGDTITLAKNPASEPLPGYQPMKPMVFCGLYPIESSQYNDLRDALEKLSLNDASLSYEGETSQALGFGFRCGFLGMLHMEITQSRIEREFNIELIATSPSVVYEVELTDHSKINIDSPAKLPDRTKYLNIYEPYIKASVLAPADYIGPIMTLCTDKRGIYRGLEYLDKTRVNIHYEMPLSEIVFDFFDKLKSHTKGYASFDYEIIDKRISNLVKMDVLINGEVVDALSIIVHKNDADKRGRAIITKLKELIPRQMFEVPIQAVIGSKVIARENIKAMRKNVLAKCYGGDVSRKRKLLEKQKEGKKRMKRVGSVDIPQEAFLSVLKMED